MLIRSTHTVPGTPTASSSLTITMIASLGVSPSLYVENQTSAGEIFTVASGDPGIALTSGTAVLLPTGAHGEVPAETPAMGLPIKKSPLAATISSTAARLLAR